MPLRGCFGVYHEYCGVAAVCQFFVCLCSFPLLISACLLVFFRPARRLEPLIKPNKDSKNSYNTAAAIDMLIDHKPKPISEAAQRWFADYDWNVDTRNFQPSSAAQSVMACDGPVASGGNY